MRPGGVGQVGRPAGPGGQEVTDAELGHHVDRLADHEAEDLPGQPGVEGCVLTHGGQDGSGRARDRGGYPYPSLIVAAEGVARGGCYANRSW
jgi:hypothetical protein